MFHLHCWHLVPDSRRKLKSKSNCKLLPNEYSHNGYVEYVMKETCCKCNKTRETSVFRDYQIDRALKYPDYEK